MTGVEYEDISYVSEHKLDGFTLWAAVRAHS